MRVRFVSTVAIITRTLRRAVSSSLTPWNLPGSQGTPTPTARTSKA